MTDPGAKLFYKTIVYLFALVKLQLAPIIISLFSALLQLVSKPVILVGIVKSINAPTGKLTAVLVVGIVNAKIN